MNQGQTVQAGELGQTHKRTDATKYIISLFRGQKKGNDLQFLSYHPLWNRQSHSDYCQDLEELRVITDNSQRERL